MNKMDPGTIISIVQLSLSGIELATKVAREFFGSDKVPDKLKRLKDRLTQFHNAVEEIRRSAGNNASSSHAYRGATAVIETLTECNEFLRQYASALSADRTPRGAGQRLVLLVGPESTRIEDFDKRIMNHYSELQYWKTSRLEKRVEVLINQMNQNHQVRDDHTYRVPSISNSPRLPESSGVFGDNFLGDAAAIYSTAHPGFPTSPSLQASPLNPPLPPIDELPSPHARAIPPLDAGSYRPYRRILETGPVMEYLRRDTASTSTTLVEHEDPAVFPSQAQSSVSLSSQSRTPGHSVKLRIGSQSYQFSTAGYRVLDVGGSRVIEWSDANTGITIRHFVRPGCNIPHTVPEDKKFRVFFLPKEAKHHFKLTEANGETQNLHGKPEYEFARKLDREVFQPNIRNYDSLEMIRALKIHSAADKDMAIKVHLKVWRQNGQDDKPTFSFAAHEVGQPSHQMEFIIRWFKKVPEVKGDNRLILRVYSKDSDMEDEPDNDLPRRRSFTFGNKGKRQSVSSSQVNIAHSGTRSRSSSNKPPLPILYESQGLEPPQDVRKLGYLEIEFLTQELRKTFIRACYEAHRPAWEASRRNSTPSPASQYSYSQPPSWKLGPNPGPYELENSGVHELEDSGRHELMAEPFMIPSPSLKIPFPAEDIHFNTRSLFAPLRDNEHERDLGPAALEESDMGPHSQEPG